MSPKLRVLVVDDERLSRETTTQQLQEAGYEAMAVENAFLALQQLEGNRWDGHRGNSCSSYRCCLG